MGQTDLIRTEFRARVTVTTPANDDIQLVDFTGYFELNDTVDVVDVDACGNIISVLADNLTLLAIDPGTSLTLSSVVDTTAATGTPMIIAQEIDDGQEAVDRLYRRNLTQAGGIDFDVREDILGQVLNSPSAGKTTYQVADTSFFRAGDSVQILSDEGLAGSATIESVNVNADDTGNYSTIVIDSVIDTSALTNPFILTTDVSIQDAIERNQERIDEIDRPVENEYIGVGDCRNAFESDNLFVQGTSKLLLDGRRLRLGTAGTRAFHAVGTFPGNNDSLKVTSLVMGLDGNSVKLAVVSGAGYTVAVTGSYPNLTVSVNDNGAAATAQGIVDAINADASAKRILQAQYGGDGSGSIAAFAATNLASGLDDGTGGYAELEQVSGNAIANTGYKWVAVHIRPNERNRLNAVPRDSEELVIDYRMAIENIDR